MERLNLQERAPQLWNFGFDDMLGRVNSVVIALGAVAGTISLSVAAQVLTLVLLSLQIILTLSKIRKMSAEEAKRDEE